MHKPPFLPYLLRCSAIVALVTQLVLLALVYWLTNPPYLLLFWGSFVVSTIITDYGRFCAAATGEPNPLMTIPEFVESHVPALIFWGLTITLGVGLCAHILVGPLVYVWSAIMLVTAIVVSYYVGRYQGMTSGLRFY